MEIGATKAVQDRLKTTKIDENKRKKCLVYCECQQSLYNSNDGY